MSQPTAYTSTWEVRASPLLASTSLLVTALFSWEHVLETFSLDSSACRRSCLFSFVWVFEKECYLRYHPFSWLLFYICAGPFPFVWSLIVCFSSSLHTYIDRCSFSVPLQTGIRISSPRELTFWRRDPGTCFLILWEFLLLWYKSVNMSDTEDPPPTELLRPVSNVPNPTPIATPSVLVDGSLSDRKPY